jgi:hypothetical protein
MLKATRPSVDLFQMVKKVKSDQKGQKESILWFSHPALDTQLFLLTASEILAGITYGVHVMQHVNM